MESDTYEQYHDAHEYQQSPAGQEYAELYPQQPQHHHHQVHPHQQHHVPQHAQQHLVTPPNRPPTRSVQYPPPQSHPHYQSSTEYAPIAGPPYQPPQGIPASPAYDMPPNVDAYSNYQSMSAGPSTPATSSNSHFTASTNNTGTNGSTSSHDSSASSPVTPNSIHSTLSHSTHMDPGRGRGQHREPRTVAHANGGSLVHRQPMRSRSHSSTEGSVSGGSRRKKRSSRGGANEYDSDGDLEAELLGTNPGADPLEQRREDARKQRQTAEQRRRDLLRDGYDRLQAVLPAGKDKMSKVRLVEYATAHIQTMTLKVQENEGRIAKLEKEREALRRQGEEISRRLNGHASPPAEPAPLPPLPPPPAAMMPSAAGLNLAPAESLPVPISGTGPAGNQRHAQQTYPVLSNHYPSGAMASHHPRHNQQHHPPSYPPRPSVRTDSLNGSQGPLSAHSQQGSETTTNGLTPHSEISHHHHHQQLRDDDGAYY